MRRARRTAVWVCLMAACGPLKPDEGGVGSTSTTGVGSPTTGVAGTTAGSSAGEATLTGGTTDGVEGSTSMSGGSDSGTILPPDFAADGSCDIFIQNCPEGEKCVPYAYDGGGAWNADKCFPVMEDPRQVGEPCFAPEGGTAGIDNCDRGLMCWDVDAEGDGVCVELCKGEPANAYCETPWTVCQISAGGTLALCLDGCDPLQQNCEPSDVCIVDPNGQGFSCQFDASGEEGQVHDPCMFPNACDPGLLCIEPTAAEECSQDAEGCCEPFCDLDDPEADMKCPGVGQVCNPYFEEGTAPPAYVNVGYCAVPT